MEVPQMPGWATYMLGLGAEDEIEVGGEEGLGWELLFLLDKKLFVHGAVAGRLEVRASTSVRRFEDS
jgi:hypothetical protein